MWSGIVSSVEQGIYIFVSPVSSFAAVAEDILKICELIYLLNFFQLVIIISATVYF